MGGSGRDIHGLENETLSFVGYNFYGSSLTCHHDQGRTGGPLWGTQYQLGQEWQNMVPLYKSDNNQYLTPDPNSNPVIYYLKWVVSENVGGFNAGIQNSHYTDGITCPYEIPDQWEYEYQREWFIDPPLKVKCTKHKP